MIVGTTVANHTDACMYNKTEESTTNSNKSMPKDIQNLDYVNDDGYTNNTRGNMYRFSELDFFNYFQTMLGSFFFINFTILKTARKTNFKIHDFDTICIF